MGPSPATLRDPGRPREWRGLSVGDCSLLATWLVRLGRRDLELHTDIPLGSVPVLSGALRTERNERLAAVLYPYRADAAVWTGGVWWLIECKPDAGYNALGQLLFYKWHWENRSPRVPVGRALIVTDHADSDLLPVAECYNVGVIELRGVLDDRVRGRRVAGGDVETG